MTQLYQWLQNDPVKFLTGLVAGCSVLHSILPPYDWKPDFVETGLADFPRAQKTLHSFFHNRWYKLLIYVVGYIALNARSTVWRSISIQNPKGVNFTKSEQTVNPVPGSGNIQ